MMLMGLSGDSQNGPGGLTCDAGQVWSDFYSSCVDACPDGQSYDSQGICGGGGDPGGGSSGGLLSSFFNSFNSGSSGTNLSTAATGWGAQNPSSQSQSTWAQILGAVTGGLSVGAADYLKGSTPTKPIAPPPAASPWYLTAPGVIGILAVVVGGAYLLTKK